MTKKNWDPRAAAQRARADNPPIHAASLVSAHRSQARDAMRGKTVEKEYVLVSVWCIDPAPWQSRIVFKDIDVLADSIRGDGETEGVGIVEPLLVRRKASGRYELIDGERRWRAAKSIAHEQPDGDYLLPVRIFEVSDRIAQLIGQVANDQRDQPKALEMAMTYVRLRQALEQESGQPVVGVRQVAGIGWHKRTMVNQYLAVAEALTPDVLRAAGILDEDGNASGDLVAGLKLDALYRIAKIEPIEDRATALRAAANRVRGIRAPSQNPSQSPEVELSTAGRLAQMRDGSGIDIRVRGPVRSLSPEAAWRIVTHDITPAVLALVEQGQGGGAGDGYLRDFDDDHAILVVPREIEQLGASQLMRLADDVSALAKRVRRAARFRNRRRPNPREAEHTAS